MALLSILNIVNELYDTVNKKLIRDFKVVYISPLKALATEIVNKFQSKLKYLGIAVWEFTGDVSLSKKEL